MVDNDLVYIYLTQIAPIGLIIIIKLQKLSQTIQNTQ